MGQGDNGTGGQVPCPTASFTGGTRGQVPCPRWDTGTGSLSQPSPRGLGPPFNGTGGQWDRGTNGTGGQVPCPTASFTEISATVLFGLAKMKCWIKKFCFCRLFGDNTQRESGETLSMAYGYLSSSTASRNCFRLPHSTTALQ